MNKIRKLDADELINYQSNIIAFRNILVHPYDSVDDEIVWAIIKRHLQPLKTEVTHLLQAN